MVIEVRTAALAYLGLRQPWLRVVRNRPEDLDPPTRHEDIYISEYSCCLSRPSPTMMAASAHTRMPFPSPHQPTGGQRIEADTSRDHYSITTSLAEAIETTRLHRVAGLTGRQAACVTTRPCHAPHHTLSDVGVIGGGQMSMPGEVSLAPHGLLCLDALPECTRHGLEAPRQPLEKSVPRISSPARSGCPCFRGVSCTTYDKPLVSPW
jgi:hypothetical protein